MVDRQDHRQVSKRAGSTGNLWKRLQSVPARHFFDQKLELPGTLRTATRNAAPRRLTIYDPFSQRHYPGRGWGLGFRRMPESWTNTANLKTADSKFLNVGGPLKLVSLAWLTAFFPLSNSDGQQAFFDICFLV